MVRVDRLVMADFPDRADAAAKQLDILLGEFFSISHNDGRFLGRCSFILHSLLTIYRVRKCTLIDELLGYDDVFIPVPQLSSGGRGVTWKAVLHT